MFNRRIFTATHPVYSRVYGCGARLRVRVHAGSHVSNAKSSVEGTENERPRIFFRREAEIAFGYDSRQYISFLRSLRAHDFALAPIFKASLSLSLSLSLSDSR